MSNWKILILIMVAITNTSFSTPQIIDKVVAIVNNDVVLKSDIDILMKLIKLNASQVNQKFSNSATVYNQILERLILDQVILQIGNKMGIKVTDKQIDQEIANIAKQNSMNESQILNLLMYHNISYNMYRNQIYKEILIAEVYSKEANSLIAVTPQEIDAIIKQAGNWIDGNTELNLSHILIPLSEGLDFKQISEIEDLAYLIISQARKNENLNEILAATKHSNVNQNKLIYDVIGWKRIQDLPFIFIQALNTAKKGDIIGPIPSEKGFHILKVNDLRCQRKSFYVTELHIRHILVKTSPIMTDDQAHKKLQQVATNIKNGNISFSDAAKKFSQDINSAKYGGDLGWVIIDVYDPTFRNALMKMNKFQISDPIRSSLGWHLIELLDTRNTDKIEIIKKDRAYRMLFNQKFSEEIDVWTQEQRANAYIKILNN